MVARLMHKLSIAKPLPSNLPMNEVKLSPIGEKPCPLFQVAVGAALILLSSSKLLDKELEFSETQRRWARVDILI